MPRAALAALCLALLTAAPAAAQDEGPYALLSREVVTDWAQSVALGRWSAGDDAADDAAEDALDLARAEAARAAGAVEDAGGRVVWSGQRLLPLAGGDVALADRPAAGVVARRVRRRARVDLLVRGPAPAGAVALSARAQVELRIAAEGLDAGRAAGGGPSARQARRRLTLGELDRLVGDAAAFRRTAAGALLAVTWERLTAGAADPGAVEARVVVGAVDLRAADGRALELADGPLDPDDAAVVLGRRAPLAARLRAALGGGEAPAAALAVDDATLLERALGAPPGDDAAWRRLVALRRADPAAWSEADRAFLRGLASPAPTGGLAGGLAGGP